jgi:hypothetical protein
MICFFIFIQVGGRAGGKTAGYLPVWSEQALQLPSACIGLRTAANTTANIYSYGSR